ncbi:hypothetical protein [Paraburkholderia sp. JHI869]|uniref:esterase/lipase family protein n=1 Tax=Paraburkholderia sp. JHI869 TaxID=3112959 RepID=UPI0031738E11
MSAETLQPLSQDSHADGSITSSTLLTPTEDKTRGVMCIRPTTVVPVIFVPGIMGSNLRDIRTGYSVWNTNNTVAIMLQWMFRSAGTRQAKLGPDRAILDDRGWWYGPSATVPDEETGKLRGQGTTSRAFYGDFVRWLDNQLNGEVKNGEATATFAGDHPGLPSPWQPFVGVEHYGKSWNAQKPFEVLTKVESDKVWANFFCPVYVQGYNWLKSNGESGKALAEKINEIINFWKDQSACGYKCEQVILVSHSMGGLVTRAAVHPEFGNAAGRVLGIVHGEQPANGAAAAYHHCRNGYGGGSGLVLGRNAAQVTAVFANSPGAMELLPNHQYNTQGGEYASKWLMVRQGSRQEPALRQPDSDPYKDIYLQQNVWWRLTDPALIDPSGKYTVDEAWKMYRANVRIVGTFHQTLGTYYHPQTYVHYGADADKHAAYGDLIWRGTGSFNLSQSELLESPAAKGSNPVKVASPIDGQTQTFSIANPHDVGYPQPGDETVPACSGEAPFKQGGGNVRQSFRLTGFEHQAAYDYDDVRICTLYAIGKLLCGAEEL